MLDESVFVLDFDGTLYQGDLPTRTFLEAVLQEVNREDLVDIAWDAVIAIASGTHSCHLGEFIALTDPPGALASVDAEHYAAHLRSLSTTQRGPGTQSHRLGDGWGLVFAVAEPLVPDITTFHRAFRAMRRQMIEGPSPYPVDSRLAEALEQLRESHRLLLYSNSPVGPDGHGLLSHLGVDELFHDIVFDAGKPGGLTECLEGVIRQTGVSPERIVSLGDHPWNDLYPAHALGAHTVLVSPYPDLDRPEWSHRVEGIDDLVKLLSEEWLLGAA